MPGRGYQPEGYRFGFNGQEKDDEVNGIGNFNMAEYWEYDTRLGRRWNLDPILSPDQSPYSCFNGNPIFYSDPSGQQGEGPSDQEIGEEGPVKQKSVPEEGSALPPDPTFDPKTMKVSEEGWDFTKKQEGFVDHVYNDAKGGASNYYQESDHTAMVGAVLATGNPTVGYGHLVTESEDNSCKYENGITRTEALILLKTDVDKAQEAVRTSATVNLTQYQFDATVDFTYNVGVGNKKRRQKMNNW